MIKRILNFMMIVSIALVLMAPEIFAADKVFPWKKIEFIVATGPGSGGDRAIRMVKNIMEKHKLIEVPIVVVNKPGGAGMVGVTYLGKSRGDGHAMYSVTNLMFLAEIYGRLGDAHYTDLGTPLATLATEWLSLSVRSDSKYKNGHELMLALKKNPQAVSFGVPMQGSDHHLAILHVAKQYGINPGKLKIIAYHGSGVMIPAILGGHVDVIATSPSTMIEQMRAGKTRLLVIAAPERMKGDLADVPIWKDFGHDVVFPHWDGLIGPPDMPADAIAWWDKTLSKFVQTPEWQGLLKHIKQEDFYMNSHDTAEFWKKDFQVYKKIAKDMGLAR